MNLSAMYFEVLFTAHSQAEIFTIEAYGIGSSPSMLTCCKFQFIDIWELLKADRNGYMQLEAIYATT